MNVVAPSGAKVYNLTAGKTLPHWIPGQSKKKLKKDQDFQDRIQLLQDFEFNGQAQQVRVSEDGYYIAAVGTYPPRLKIYAVEDLALKCERGLDAEVVQFSFLSEDYRKLALLQVDRHIELQSQEGAYYKVRIPKIGRDMIFDRSNAELYTATSGKEIYRLNLSTGQFQSPFESTSMEGNNCIDQHLDHQLIVTGGDHGIVECFDPRNTKRVGQLNVKNQVGSSSITSIAFDQSESMKLAVGTDSGVILLYDIRSSTPLLVKDHQYELPIKDIKFKENFCISTDEKICKIWDKNTSKPLVNIESEFSINRATIVPNSGLMFLPQQKDKIEIYYVPSLGVAPFWCSFLDNLTEELEDDNQSIMYDDYKFVTRNELESFGLNKLIGTPYLRAYMHGFFMDSRLYRKVFDITNPYGYKEYVQDRIKKKREEQQASRITKKRKTPKVNRFFNERYLQDLKGDERFGDLLKKDDFAIDTNSEEYANKLQQQSSENDNGDFDQSELRQKIKQSKSVKKQTLASRVKRDPMDIQKKSKGISKNMEFSFVPATKDKRKRSRK